MALRGKRARSAAMKAEDEDGSIQLPRRKPTYQNAIISVLQFVAAQTAEVPSNDSIHDNKKNCSSKKHFDVKTNKVTSERIEAWHISCSRNHSNFNSIPRPVKRDVRNFLGIYFVHVRNSCSPSALLKFIDTFAAADIFLGIPDGQRPYGIGQVKRAFLRICEGDPPDSVRKLLSSTFQKRRSGSSMIRNEVLVRGHPVLEREELQSIYLRRCLREQEHSQGPCYHRHKHQLHFRQHPNINSINGSSNNNIKSNNNNNKKKKNQLQYITSLDVDLEGADAFTQRIFTTPYRESKKSLTCSAGPSNVSSDTLSKMYTTCEGRKEPENAVVLNNDDHDVVATVVVNGGEGDGGRSDAWNVDTLTDAVKSMWTDLAPLPLSLPLSLPSLSSSHDLPFLSTASLRSAQQTISKSTSVGDEGFLDKPTSNAHKFPDIWVGDEATLGRDHSYERENNRLEHMQEENELQDTGSPLAHIFTSTQEIIVRITVEFEIDKNGKIKSIFFSKFTPANV